MRVFLSGGIGDRFAFTATLREYKRAFPREEIHLIEPNKIDEEIYRHSPWLGYGQEENGLVVKLQPMGLDRFASIPHYYAKQLGFTLVDDTPEIWLTREERSADYGLPASARRSVAIDPWCAPAWTSRRWPHERYVQLVSRLREEGWFIVEIGRNPNFGGSEKLPPLGADLDVSEKLSIRETCGLLSRVDLMIGADSGGVHMAAAAGAPQVSIFSVVKPIDRAYYNTTPVAPYSDCSKDCLMDCVRWERPNKLNRCIDEVGVERVVDAAEISYKRFSFAARAQRPEVPRNREEVFAALDLKEYRP